MTDRKKKKPAASFADMREVCEKVLGLDVEDRGGTAFILCPFHRETVPSMQLNRDYAYCYGCHVSADAVGIVEKVKNVGREEARRMLSGFRHTESSGRSVSGIQGTVPLSSEALCICGITDRRNIRELMGSDMSAFTEFVTDAARNALGKLGALSAGTDDPDLRREAERQTKLVNRLIGNCVLAAKTGCGVRIC